MLSEIKRIIRPGGYLFIREHDVPKDNEKLVTELTDLHSKFKDYRPGEIYNFWGRRDLRIELNSKGF